jgi:hypothetical protein
MKDFYKLKTNIQHQAKNGVDFILGAAIVWYGIYFIWTMDFSPYNKSVLTFMFGAVLLPLVFGLSKIFKTNWKIKDNPLQPLGLWLNFAQLIYFPMLIFMLIKNPDYFIMTYAIITGAHLFPYAWFYDEIGYAVTAIVISVGSLIIGLTVGPERIFFIPVFTAVVFSIFAIWILYNNKKRIKPSHTEI